MADGIEALLESHETRLGRLEDGLQGLGKDVAASTARLETKLEGLSTKVVEGQQQIMDTVTSTVKPLTNGFDTRLKAAEAYIVTSQAVARVEERVEKDRRIWASWVRKAALPGAGLLVGALVRHIVPLLFK